MVFSVYLVIMTVSVLSILLVLWMRKRKRAQLTNNVAYNIHDHEIQTDTNEAYHRLSDIGSGVRDISTSAASNGPDNRASVLEHVNGTSTPVYDYPIVQS